MSGNAVVHPTMGDNPNANNNFTLSSENEDGTLVMYRGNFGSPLSEVFRVPASGPMKIAGVSSIGQVVRFASSTLNTGTNPFPITSAPTTSSGNLYMTLSITPTNIASVIEIDAKIMIAHSVANNWMSASLFLAGNPTAIDTSTQYQSISTASVMLPIKGWVTAGTISAMTFNIYGGGTQVGTTTYNGSGSASMFGGTTILSSMTIREWLP